MKKLNSNRAFISLDGKKTLRLRNQKGKKGKGWKYQFKFRTEENGNSNTYRYTFKIKMVVREKEMGLLEVQCFVERKHLKYQVKDEESTQW